MDLAVVADLAAAALVVAGAAGAGVANKVEPKVSAKNRVAKVFTMVQELGLMSATMSRRNNSFSEPTF